MNSLFRSVAYAREHDIEIEVVIVMDRSDAKTCRYYSRYSEAEIKFDRVDFGDLGLTRNHGVSLSSGKYIAFLDEDNLFGKKWLHHAFQYLEGVDRSIIVHPEFHVVFGAKRLIWHQISSTAKNFSFENLLEANWWDSVCMAKKDIFVKYPYETTTQGVGFGFEDWHFNCQTLADGIEHHVVPCTVHFLRIKDSGSLLEYTLKTNRLIRPTKLFEPDRFSSLLDAKNTSVSA
jgi:glycosyl transferase family 2